MPAEPSELPAPTGRLAQFLLYGASRSAVEGMMGFRGFLLAIVLGPQAFGAWSLFRLVCRYGTMLNLGIGPGVEREVVRARTSGEPDAFAEGARWGRSATSYIWVFFGILGIACAIASFVVEDPDTALTLRALVFGLLLERLWNYAKTYLRVVTSLRHYAVVELWQALFQVVSTCLGAWLWGLPGVFVGFIVSSAASLMLVVKEVPFRPLFSGKRLRRLISVGLPLVAFTIMVLGLTTVDRLVIVSIGGTALLGTYSFAVAVAGLSTSLAWSIRTVVVPEVYAGSKRDSGVNAQRHLDETVRPFSLLYPLLLGAFAILIGPVIYYLAPAYREGVTVAQLFVFTGATAGLNALGALPVVAAGRQRAIPIVAAVTFGANAVFAGIAVMSGWGLWIVAAGAVGARTLLAMGTLRLANGVTSVANPWLATIRMVVPLLWCVVSVTMIERFVGGYAPLQVLEALGLYALAIAPWAPAALRAARRARADHA